MITIRSRFYKKDHMVFISHLDLIRVFERAIRRANIPVSYTKGFNPRPIMAFATALGIGVASEGEYIDIQVSEDIDSNLFMDRLNKVLPDGLKIIKSVTIDSKAPSLMSIIDSSIYLVKLKISNLPDKLHVTQCIEDFLNKETIIETRERKQRRGRRNRGAQVREINIRPLIKGLELVSLIDDEAILKIHLSTGSKENLKPEIVVEKLHDLTDLPIQLEDTRIHRLDLFVNKNDKLMTPLDEDVWKV